MVTVRLAPDAKEAIATARPGPGGEIAAYAEDSMARATLVFHCLGPFAVYQDGEKITEWNGLKGLTILKYLVAEQGKPVGKEVLMDVLWPEAEPEAARRNLHQAIYSLRQALRGSGSDIQHIQFHNECYRFHPNLEIWIDYVQFEHYAKRGQRLEAGGRKEDALDAYSIAEELYQGGFLEEDLYEEWAIRRREQLRTLYLDVADRLATWYVARGETTVAMALARKMLAQDRCCEEAHRHLIYCHGVQGQRHLAIRQYQTCVDALESEFGLEPSERTQALFRKVTAG